METPSVVVGIGASAGGLEALRPLLPHLPRGMGMAFVMARHVATRDANVGGPSLARQTGLAVREITGRMALERDTIYIPPPDANVIVEPGAVALESPDLRGPTLPVDRLFTTLAGAYGANAAAVLLAGTGQDGARGLEAVQARGGHVYGQTGRESATLTLEGIATGLASLARDRMGPQPVATGTAAGGQDWIAGGQQGKSEIDFRYYPPKIPERWGESRRVTVENAGLDEYAAMAGSTGRNECVAVVDAEGTIAAANARWRALGGAGRVSCAGSGVGTNYLDVCDAAARNGDVVAAEVASALRAVLRGAPAPYSKEYVCFGPEGTRWFRCSVTPLEEARAGGAVVFYAEITEQVLALEKIKRQATALESAGNAICIVDREGRIDWVNEAFERVSGYTPGELLGRTQEFLMARPPLEERLAALLEEESGGQVWKGEVMLTNKRGESYAVHQTITPIRPQSGPVTHYVVIQEDITPRKQMQLHMLRMAERDELTGTWNRKSFQRRLAQAIRRHQESGKKLGVYFVDLDRFGNTNDVLGHFVGDQVLQAVALRLQGEIGEEDTLARLGGDEFAILVEGLADREAVAKMAGFLVAAFQAPVEADRRPVRVTASVGVTFYPDDGATAETLLRNADLAMHQVKQSGRRGFRFFDSDLERAMRERAEVERELARSLDDSQFWVAFQPLMDLRSDSTVGAECLLRWKRAEAQRVAISRVIQIAEESGMILPIGDWMMGESFAQVGSWHAAGHALDLSLNLSAVQIHHQDVFTNVTKMAERHGVPLRSVKVEITESVLLNRTAGVMETLHALRGAGIGLVLDDFGTGYASLSYLQQFPIGTVKIDGSFVRGIGTNASDEAIVRGVILLAHSLGQDVVAEGVETRLQLDFLKACGCDRAQGYLFSRPLAPERFVEYLASGGRRTRP